MENAIVHTSGCSFWSHVCDRVVRDFSTGIRVRRRVRSQRPWEEGPTAATAKRLCGARPVSRVTTTEHCPSPSVLGPDTEIEIALTAKELFCSRMPFFEGGRGQSLFLPRVSPSALEQASQAPEGETRVLSPGVWTCHPSPRPGGHRLFLLSVTACRASDAQRRSSQPSSLEDLKGDGIKKGQGAGLRSIWHGVQGEPPEGPGRLRGGLYRGHMLFVSLRV